ncbi:Maf family protein [Sinanaerobacter chloroacetimidivorans]|jgi:septum formation protein|uniref:dTTP/UTP pyrophosphatase n=1 Tax=Sinanaerobacter chloroacetimidivorans TaxID=2818044 RepID=A0A8J7W254_9FIRM|nr:Maf family protein [Sinanaerobacter chloroacetimidivorans]MBR0599492.1 septum formation protein Maf [Sinanaerobacter chloroacetimidivorans]
MKYSKLILASSSPRRIEKLKNQDIQPVIMPPDVDESLPVDITMEQAVMYLALKKALQVESKWESHPEYTKEPVVIIAADTVVYKNQIIGKPADYQDALHILRTLRNTSHFVATGIALLSPGTTMRKVFYDITEVFFTDYTDADIEAYIQSGEAWDKAGAYGIQGYWGKYVSRLHGSFDNVMGFPWDKIKTELDKF